MKIAIDHEWSLTKTCSDKGLSESDPVQIPLHQELLDCLMLSENKRGQVKT